jgi:hypothetical protein
MTTMKDRGRSKVEVQLLTADREALDRCCVFMGQTMTRFLTNRIRKHERETLQRLGEDQRALYRDGCLILEEMPEEEQAAFSAPRPAILDAETDERLARLIRLAGDCRKDKLVEVYIRKLEETWLGVMTEPERQRYLSQTISPEDIAAIRRRRRGPDPKPAPEPDPEPQLDPELAKMFLPEMAAE